MPESHIAAVTAAPVAAFRCPLDALRTYLVDQVTELIGTLGEGGRAAYVRTIQSSDVLQVRERELVFESEQRLAAALRDAWSERPRTDPGFTPRWGSG